VEQKTYQRKEDLIPDGKYTMRVKDLFYYETKSGKKTLKVILIVHAPGTEYDGFELHRMIWNSEQSVAIFHRELSRLNIEVTSYEPKEGNFLHPKYDSELKELVGQMINVSKTTSLGKTAGMKFTNLNFVSIAEGDFSKVQNNGDDNELPF